MFLTLFLILFAAISMGTFAGLLVSANCSFGSFSFSEPRKDIVRSLVVGLVTAGVCVGLMALTRNPRVLAGLIPIWYITVKLCWLEMESVDMAVVAFSCLVFTAAAALFAVKVLR
jgi:hypothetical protein